MAFLVGAMQQFNNVRAPRDFKRRKTLADICEREIKNYRISRAMIEELIDAYRVSIMSNSTKRSFAISAETEVRKNGVDNKNKILFLSSVL